MTMFVAVVFVVTLYIIRTNKYDERIQERDNKIELYESWNDSLADKLEIRMDQLDSIESTIPIYADSINDLRVQRTLLKREYEKQISDILAIPVDSVYREVTRWLNER